MTRYVQEYIPLRITLGIKWPVNIQLYNPSNIFARARLVLSFQDKENNEYDIWIPFCSENTYKIHNPHD